MTGPWVNLLLAGAFEICWAVGLKYSAGFSKPLPTVLTFIAMAISIWFLAIAVRQLDLGTAYAVWTGIGAIGTVIAGVILFAEPVNAVRIGCIGLILLGIIGLKLTTAS